MGKAVARHTTTKAGGLLEAQAILELRLQGMSDIEICERLRISRSTLQRRVEWALKVRVDPTVEQYRQEATARIHLARKRIFQELATGERWLIDPATGEDVKILGAGPVEVSSLVGRLAQLEDLEAKLRGAYAPTQVDVTVRDGLIADLEAALARGGAPVEA